MTLLVVAGAGLLFGTLLHKVYLAYQRLSKAYRSRQIEVIEACIDVANLEKNVGNDGQKAFADCYNRHRDEMIQQHREGKWYKRIFIR